jgi:hypothetical protein
MTWTFYVCIGSGLLSFLASSNLYRISKNQEREIAVLKVENAMLKAMIDVLTKRTQ